MRSSALRAILPAIGEIIMKTYLIDTALPHGFEVKHKTAYDAIAEDI